MQPLVPGFSINGEVSSSATGSAWVAVRNLDDHRVVLRVFPVADTAEAQVQASQQLAVLSGIGNEHLVRHHGAIALAGGTLALVQDEVTGGSLAQVLGARGQLTSGETVTTVAPLFGALAELHAAGVVHGDLTPGTVVFSADGRPLINDLGVASLLGRHAGSLDETTGFVAPELVAGAAPSPASDVYAMAALGWFCLAGAPPVQAANRPSLTVLRPQTPAALVAALTSCLSTDPAARPLAAAAAVEVFDAAPAEPVAQASMSDPAAEITRRIRVGAVSSSAAAAPSITKRHRDRVVIGAVALLVAVALGGGTTWFLRRPPATVRPAAVGSVAQPSLPPVTKAPGTKAPGTKAPATQAPSTRLVARTAKPQTATEVVTATDSPRKAAAGLLQALVDARALAYVARSTALLDLVYAPGAAKAGADRANISTALKNGATYLGLSFVVRDVAFLDGTSNTARIRATILTPAYETGQPDGRKVGHARDTVGPSVFALTLTPDGWRILSLTAS